MAAKGYWIAQVDVSNPEEYKAYQAANAVPLRLYGGHFLVRGGTAETVEGKSRSRVVVLEFKDLKAIRVTSELVFRVLKVIRDFKEMLVPVFRGHRAIKVMMVSGFKVLKVIRDFKGM